jgi:hypothetical protein
MKSAAAASCLGVSLVAVAFLVAVSGGILSSSSGPPFMIPH